METEARFTAPRGDCLHPGRWHSPDPDSTEIEVSRLAAAFVGALRPDLVVETGTAFGQTAELLGSVMLAGDYGGKVISFEVDKERVERSCRRCADLPVEIRQESSLDGLGIVARQIEKNVLPPIGFAWLDSLFELRIPELQLVHPVMMPGGIVGVHDCGQPGRTKYPQFSLQVAEEAQRLGFTRISLPTPRGVTWLQKW